MNKWCSLSNPAWKVVWRAPPGNWIIVSFFLVFFFGGMVRKQWKHSCIWDRWGEKRGMMIQPTSSVMWAKTRPGYDMWTNQCIGAKDHVIIIRHTVQINSFQLETWPFTLEVSAPQAHLPSKMGMRNTQSLKCAPVWASTSPLLLSPWKVCVVCNSRRSGESRWTRVFHSLFTGRKRPDELLMLIWACLNQKIGTWRTHGGAINAWWRVWWWCGRKWVAAQ